jgi:hypothetical protein
MRQHVIGIVDDYVSHTLDESVKSAQIAKDVPLPVAGTAPRHQWQ